MTDPSPALDFAEIHDDLRAVARDLLGSTGKEADADWALLARSGWLGLEVPVDQDGSGATFAETAVVLGEMGRAATRSPYLGAVVLAVGALQLVAPGARRDDLRREVATGEVVVAVALSADGEASDADAAPFRMDRSGEGLRVHGGADFVPDATEADRILLPALDPERRPVLVAVDRGAPGLAVVDEPVLDATRRLARVRAEGVEVDAASVLPLTDADGAIARLRDRAAVAIACDSLGLSEAMLEATVAYAGAREQFGRPIGSFQAVKHQCADLLVQISVARALVAAAVAQVATDGSEASVAASMAKSFTGDAAVAVAGTAMQLHGGIGYTWESGIHVYLKRATLNRSLFGSSGTHRRRLAQRHV